MDVLKELVYIVNRNKIKQIDLLDLQDTGTSRVNELYGLIAEGKVADDESAIAAMFPDNPSSSAYRNIKSSLFQRLINTAFFIDSSQPGYSDRQHAYYYCYREYAAVCVLLGKNARRSSVFIAERILKHAEYYEFTELCLDLSRILRLHYGTRARDLKRYEYYKNLYAKYRTICDQESEAEEKYADLMMHYTSFKTAKVELSQLAEGYYASLAPSLSVTGTYKLHLYAALIRLFISTSINDHAATLSMTEETIRFFESKPFEANTPIQICLYHQLLSHIQLRDYAAGKEVADRCLSLLEEGSFNWFKYYELYFQLAMHSEQYDEANRVYQAVSSHKRFLFLPQNVREMWGLYEAYLAFLGEVGQLNQLEAQFRVGRFLNNMPNFARDKRGMNVAMLTIQILLYLVQKKYSLAQGRLDALERYCSRYLYKHDTMRAYYFIRMLLTFPQAGYHVTGVERRAEKYLQQLQQIPLAAVNQQHKIEIIPYENLWKMALLTLDDKLHKTAARRRGLSSTDG